jgi:hypothetical protein
MLFSIPDRRSYKEALRPLRFVAPLRETFLDRVGREVPSTGSPEAVARLRLPQNVACGFPALRSSEIDSQHSDGFQLPVGKHQPWSQQRKAFLYPMENGPREGTFTASATQHLVPVTFNRPVQSLQATKISRYTIVGIVPAKHSIKIDRLLLDRQVPRPSHQVA